MSKRPDFLGLEAFVAIAERSSFNKAAVHLGITQTALSHRIRKLEAYVGVALLNRTTRSVSLTPAGVSLLPRARTIMDEARKAFDQLGEEAAVRQDRLAIGCLPTLAIHFLPRVLSVFLQDHPDVSVRVFDNSASEIVERVQKGDAEFGLTILTTNRWDLDIKPLIREAYVLVCNNDHPFSRRKSVTWAQLAGEPLIRISTQTGNRVLIDDSLGAAGEKLRWSSEVQHVTTAVALVSSGVGMTVVPRGTMEAVRQGNLVTVPLRNPSIVRTLGVVTRHGIPLSPLASALLKLIEAHLPAAGTRKRLH